jgi:ketopantoate reductase
MKKKINSFIFSGICRRFAAGIAISGLYLFAGSAMAGQSEAEEAIARASAKIEMVVRMSGQAGDSGDQSFNRARQRLSDARESYKKGHYDTAEMMAEESALLAALTSERARLAALQTSHNNLLATSNSVSDN